jgi:hypothetical protein
LRGKSYRGEETNKYLTIFCTCWFKKTPKNEALFSQKVPQFKKNLFLRHKIEENIVMDIAKGCCAKKPAIASFAIFVLLPKKG